MHKLTKKLLRIWLSITSVAVFAIGWITLAHAQKPAPLNIPVVGTNASNDVTELAPILTIEELTQNVSQPSFSMPGVNLSMPRLRTRGS